MKIIFKNTEANAHRLLLSFLGLFSALLLVFFYFEYRSLGFPDGHLTELDRIRKSAYLGLMGMAAAFLLYSMLSRFIPPSKRLRTRLVLVLFATGGALYFLLECFGPKFFEHGSGG